MKSLVRCFISFLFILFACSCQNTTDENTDHKVFRYNESSNITSLDPAFAKVQSNIWACNHIFNGLVQLNDSLKVIPDIAQSWKISDNGLLYEFTLRKDVKFHDSNHFANRTRTVSATDFEYSFSRLLDDKVASPGRWILQNVETFAAKNDSVFEIQLKQPFPGFLGLLSMKYASVVPKEVVEATANDFRSHPIGTGPFQFKIWEENVKLVLRKNDNYFEKDENGQSLPYLEAVAITFLPDKQSGFLQFVQGKIDFISGLDPSYKDEILTQRGDLQQKYANSINLITGPYLNTEYLGFRMDGDDKSILDKRIRQALNYGFDRKKMVLYLRNNMGIPATNGMIPKGLPGFASIEGYDYNPQKARELVNSYTKETGIIPKITLSSNATYADISEFLQREWQKSGLQVEIDMSPPSTLRQAISTGKVSFFRASWIADYPDAENYLSLFYSKNFTPNGPNYTHFTNATFDKLYEQASKETDDEKRFTLYKQMDELVIAEAPVIPLFYDKVARFTRNSVSGIGINPLNLLSLKRVKKLKEAKQ